MHFVARYAWLFKDNSPILKNPIIEKHPLSEKGQELHRQKRAGQGDELDSGMSITKLLH